VRDDFLAARHWKRTDDVWWPDGPSDVNVRVLRLEPALAELWDGPASKEVTRHEFRKARATGREPNVGQNRKVTVSMD
jgi:general stress protein 26